MPFGEAEETDTPDTLHIPDHDAVDKTVAAASRALNTRRLYKLQDYRLRRNITGILSVVLVLLLFVPSFDSGGAKIGWFLFSLISVILFMSGASLWVTAPKRAYLEDYKYIVLPRIAALFGLKYSAGSEISQDTMQSFGILPSAIISDMGFGVFYGHYKGAEICFSDFMLFEDRAHRGKPMRAFAIMLELGRESFGHTVVVQDRFRLFKSHFGTSGLRRADMVDPVFEKKYDVFTNDQVEARYLIGPDMIEKIGALHDAALGSEMAIAFKDRASFVFFKGGELGIIPQAVKEGDVGLCPLRRHSCVGRD